IFYEPVIKQLASPFCSLGESSSENYCGDLYVNGLIGPFTLQLKVAFITGILISAPIWLYQIWSFITPALHKRERRFAIFFVGVATPLFTLGATCAYLILPHAVKILLGFTPSDLGNLIRFDEYLDFVLRLILLFGIAFVLPLFLLSLNILGLVSGRSLLKPWRLAVFLIFLFTAAFTPTPDPITMTVLAIPLCILYFTAGIIALLIDRKRSKRSVNQSLNATAIDPAEPI
ncbi:MAG: twin-arginine translocase subunit TatC, partial [Actinobacteria bacterium]|nr:twin-arginine translocase subunit TatC [Actinomycetota bacterium]